MIKVVVVDVKNHAFSNRRIIEKELISVGADSKCDVVCSSAHVSANHGKILFVRGLKSHLEYDDTSTNGTLILRWKDFKADPIFVKGSKVNIHPSDWICIVNKGFIGIIIIIQN